MKRIIFLSFAGLAMMYSCNGHIEKDDSRMPVARKEDDGQIDIRVIKPSDTTKLEKEHQDSLGREYK